MSVKRLLNNHEGSVAPLLALLALPLFGFVGAAVDYSHANAIKVSLQMAVDSTALMLSKTAASLTSDQLQTKANDYFNALFTRTDAYDVQLNTTYSNTDASQIDITATAKVQTHFMYIMGFASLQVGTESVVKWGNTKLRVALVLDNTGSMASSGKLTALKTATNNLLDQLKKSATNSADVYVSIIPFVKDVNVGSSNYDQAWIDWSDWDDNNGSCSRGSAFNTRNACTTTPACSKTQYTSQTQCLSHSGTWFTTAGIWTVNSHTTWNGCVTDRGNTGGPSAGAYDTNVTPPNMGLLATLFPAEQYSSCPQAILPLTNDWTTMATLVNNMVAAGNTNQAIGLAHGWQSLVGGGPYPTPPTMDPKYKYQQVVILMTDGLNTQDRWYSCPSNGPCPTIDARQQVTCDNFKAASTSSVTNVIYTVQVDTDGGPVSPLLQNCASSSDKFFFMTSADQLVSVFNQIGIQLSNLRVAK